MKIIYEDSQIIVCYKEAGLPVQSARIGTKDLENLLKTYLWEQSGKEPYLAVVHRLDQPVEGILVFAKSQKAAAGLSAQVTDGRMKKTYHAVVCLPGEDCAQEGTLVDYLLKDGKSNASRMVSENIKGAKRAELEYRILQTRQISQTGQEPENLADGKKSVLIKNEGNPANIALVEIDLHTGRHHQIRVQMSGAKMPLLGDRKYASQVEVLMEEEAIPGCCEAGWQEMRGQLALCAVSLELLHPSTGKKMQFRCEPQGEYFKLF